MPVMAKSPMKPFAISKHEQLVLTTYLNPLKHANQEERHSRRDVWDEFGLRTLKRQLDAMPTEEEPNPQGKIKISDWASDEPGVRVELHGGTITYVIKKLDGELVGPAGDVLGELADRLIALRDTADPSTITKKDGSGYKLPRALWTAEEVTADEPPPRAEPSAG